MGHGATIRKTLFDYCRFKVQKGKAAAIEIELPLGPVVEEMQGEQA